MKKKQIGILVSIAVIAVVAIGFTLALLHSTTETKTNAFSSNKNISIQLREPAWDGYTFEDEDSDGSKAKDGVIADPNNKDHFLGVNEAKNYLPGQTIYKDPTVKNNGDTNKGSVPVYVAIKVQYYQGIGENEKQISYEDFKEAFLEKGINFNDQWSDITKDGNMDQIYLYGGSAGQAKALEVEATTEALFTEVPISLDLEPGADGKLPGFNIKVQAYAIQTAGIEAKNAGSELLKFIGQN